MVTSNNEAPLYPSYAVLLQESCPGHLSTTMAKIRMKRQKSHECSVPTNKFIVEELHADNNFECLVRPLCKKNREQQFLLQHLRAQSNAKFATLYDCTDKSMETPEIVCSERRVLLGDRPPLLSTPPSSDNPSLIANKIVKRSADYKICSVDDHYCYSTENYSVGQRQDKLPAYLPFAACTRCGIDYLRLKPEYVPAAPPVSCFESIRRGQQVKRSFEQLSDYEQQQNFSSSSSSSAASSSLALSGCSSYSPASSSSYLSPRHHHQINSNNGHYSPPLQRNSFGSSSSHYTQYNIGPPPPPPPIFAAAVDSTHQKLKFAGSDAFTTFASSEPIFNSVADFSAQKRPFLLYNGSMESGGLLASNHAVASMPTGVQQQHILIQNGANGNGGANIASPTKFENKKAKIDGSKTDNDSAFSACSSQSSGAASPHRHTSPGASPEPAAVTTNGYNHHISTAGSSMSADASASSTPHQHGQTHMSSSASNASNENGASNGIQVNGSMRRDSVTNNHPSCPTEPSKVVHFRGVSLDAQEADVYAVCLPFGKIKTLLSLKHKSQALVEFEDEQSAIRLVSQFTSPSRLECKIAGRKCYVQYSNHKEIKLNERNQNGNDMSPMLNALGPLISASQRNGGGFSPYQINNLLAAAVQQQQHGSPSILSPTYAEHGRLITNGGGSTSAGSSAHNTSTSDGSPPGSAGGANTVLRVIIENVGQALGADALYPVFSKFGQVLKIITFVKDRNSQALIQFAHRDRAAVCKQCLDNKLLFPGCAMRVEYSRMSNLEINRNNDRNRDYSDQPFPPPGAGDLGHLNGAGGMPQVGSHGSMSMHPASMLSPGAGGAGGGGTSAYQLQQVQQVAAALLGINPQLINQVLNSQNHQSPGGYSTSPYGNNASGQMNGGNHALLPHSALANNLMHANLLNMAPQLLPNLGGSPAGGVGGAGSPVVHVSNLNDTKVLPDTLFKLFGVYGDVQRVKIMFAKRDTALVQMADASQARNAIRHLDKARLYGRPLKLTLSNKPEVKLPQEWQDAKQDAGLTRDYNNSPMHRFKRPYSSNFRNVYPPSDTLHLSNVPSNKTEDDIREAFKQAGYDAQAFRYFTNDQRMALIQFASPEEATEALIAMHNFDFKDGNYLRVSFSKSRIN